MSFPRIKYGLIFSYSFLPGRVTELSLHIIHDITCTATMLQNDTKFGTGIATLYIPVIIKTMKYNYNQLSVSVSSILLPSKTLSMAHFCNL